VQWQKQELLGEMKAVGASGARPDALTLGRERNRTRVSAQVRHGEVAPLQDYSRGIGRDRRDRGQLQIPKNERRREARQVEGNLKVATLRRVVTRARTGVTLPAPLAMTLLYWPLPRSSQALIAAEHPFQIMLLIISNDGRLYRHLANESWGNASNTGEVSV
jgi:hypothetical protein